MMNREALVFDVGGTSIRAGIFDAESRILVARTEAKTPNNHHFSGATQAQILDRLVAEMKSLGDSLLGSTSPSAVVAGVPGPVDSSGTVLSLPTVVGRPLEEPFRFLDELRNNWRAPVHVINDLTAAGYRYVAAGNKQFCLLSCGSGVGLKVFVDETPLLGETFLGGEVGHLVVDHRDDALICDCGGRGHLGAIVSGRGIRSLAMHIAKHEPRGFSRSKLGGISYAQLTTENIVSAFREGDAWTRNVLCIAARPLSQILASIHLSTGVDRFILIGGFAIAAGSAFLKLIADNAQSFAGAGRMNWDKMLTLGFEDDDHGLVGAGYFGLMRSSK